MLNLSVQSKEITVISSGAFYSPPICFLGVLAKEKGDYSFRFCK